MEWFQVADMATPAMRANDYETCKGIIVDAINSCDPSPFHRAISSKFSNKPEDIAAHITEFIANWGTKRNNKVIYAEMNGFDINPDMWFFSLFGFDKDHGVDDLDWLSDWQSESTRDMRLTGMEDLQAIYKENGVGSDQAGLASLLIVVKFQELMFNSRRIMGDVKATLYSTAHEYDFISKC